MRRTLALLLLAAAALTAGPPVTITVLATTDLHGNLTPIDYVTNQPAPRGLAKIATLVRQVRAANPNTVLIDCGDTIQGTPLEGVYQTSGSTLGDPMMRAMSLLRYDAMAVGNHEYNVGLANLARARRDASFPWLSANTVVAAGGSQRPYEPFIVKTVSGVKIAIIGITTPVIPQWEKPENLGAYRFTAPVEALRSTLAILNRSHHPDLVIVAAHSGLGRSLETGAPDEPAENVVYQLASEVLGIDAIVYGHSHSQLEGRLVNNVLLVQPKNWGASLARLDFTFERGGNNVWKLAGKQSHLLPVTAHTASADDIMALAKPYEDAAQRYLETPVATSTRALSAARGRDEDTAVVDAIQRVQLHYSQADVSFTALFNPEVRIPQGQVTVRQIAALIEGTGKMVKDALENSARYYSNTGIPGFNYDMAEGLEYEVDRARPEGDRIRNLRWKGKPLDPNQKLRIALNNYRAGGSGGYTMFKDAKVHWRASEGIRELLILYYTEKKSIPTEPTNNWRILN